MDLGALICTPKSTSCMLFPVQTHCKAFREGVERDLPIKSKAKKQKRIAYYAFAVQNEDGEYLIEQRPDSGLLANMWQFPMAEKQKVDEEHILTWMQQVYGVSVSLTKNLLPIKHIFSHVIWEMDIIHVTVNKTNAKLKHGRFVDLHYLEEYPFPVPHQKLVDQLINTVNK